MYNNHNKRADVVQQHSINNSLQSKALCTWQSCVHGVLQALYEGMCALCVWPYVAFIGCHIIEVFFPKIMKYLGDHWQSTTQIDSSLDLEAQIKSRCVAVIDLYRYMINV